MARRRGDEKGIACTNGARSMVGIMIFRCRFFILSPYCVCVGRD